MKTNYKLILAILIAILIFIIGRWSKPSGNNAEVRQWRKERKELLDSASHLIREAQEKVEAVLEDRAGIVVERDRIRQERDSLLALEPKIVLKEVDTNMTDEEVTQLAIELYEKATGNTVNNN